MQQTLIPENFTNVIHTHIIASALNKKLSITTEVTSEGKLKSFFVVTTSNRVHTRRTTLAGAIKVYNLLK